MKKERICLTSSLNNPHSLSIAIWGSVYYACFTVFPTSYPRSFTVDRVLETIEGEKLTMLTCSGSQLQTFLDNKNNTKKKYDTSTLQKILVVDDEAGLSTLNFDSLAQRALNETVQEVYLYSANLPVVSKYTKSNKSIISLPNVESKIIGSNGKPVSSNTTGELVTRGYHVGSKAARIVPEQKNMRPVEAPTIQVVDDWIATGRQASMDDRGNIKLA